MRIVMPLGFDVRDALHKGLRQRRNAEKEERGGKKGRINAVTRRWHNFAETVQVQDVQHAAVLTHKPLDVNVDEDVGGVWASHLSL